MQSPKIPRLTTVGYSYGQETNVSLPCREERELADENFSNFVAQFPQKLVDVLEKHEAELVEESVSFEYDYWTSGTLHRGSNCLPLFS